MLEEVGIATSKPNGITPKRDSDHSGIMAYNPISDRIIVSTGELSEFIKDIISYEFERFTGDEQQTVEDYLEHGYVEECVRSYLEELLAHELIHKYDPDPDNLIDVAMRDLYQFLGLEPPSEEAMALFWNFEKGTFNYHSDSRGDFIEDIRCAEEYGDPVADVLGDAFLVYDSFEGSDQQLELTLSYLEERIERGWSDNTLSGIF